LLVAAEVTHLLENWRSTRNTWQFEREDRGLILGPLRLAVGAVRRTKLLGLKDGRGVVAFAQDGVHRCGSGIWGAEHAPHLVCGGVIGLRDSLLHQGFCGGLVSGESNEPSQYCDTALMSIPGCSIWRRQWYRADDVDGGG
jgi:hypothetical protein